MFKVKEKYLIGAEHQAYDKAIELNAKNHLGLGWMKSQNMQGEYIVLGIECDNDGGVLNNNQEEGLIGYTTEQSDDSQKQEFNYQINAISKKPYSGDNSSTLAMAFKAGEYKYPIWLTYRQAKALNGQVKKGEKGQRILYFSKTKKENGKEGAFRKYYTVFNIEQCEGETVTNIREEDGPILLPEYGSEE